MQKKSVDQSAVKHTNQLLILNLLRNKENMTRADLARTLALSRPSVSTNVEDLIRKGAIMECDSSLQGDGPGRRGVGIMLNEDYGYMVAADLSSSKIRIGIADFSGSLVTYEEAEVIENKEASVIAELLYKSICDSLSKKYISTNRVKMILVCAPGIVNQITGEMRFAERFLNWNQLNLKQFLSNRFQTEVCVLNDINVRTYAEVHMGIGRLSPNFAHINIDSGIGSGIVINGALVEGSRFSSGEIGFTLVNNGLNQNDCRIEYLENLVSIPALQNVLSERLNVEKETLSMQWICEQYELGVQTVVDEVELFARRLGVAIINLNAVLDLPIVSLGGRITSIGTRFLKYINDFCSRVTIPNTVEIVYSELGEKGFVFGAFQIMQEKLISKIVEG